MACIYAIECKRNGFAYVGYTANARKRFREHRCLLRNKLHSSAIMVDEWHKYGEASFDIRILQSVPDDATVPEKREAELKWIMHYKGAGLLYNLAATSFAGTPESIRKAIEASRHVAGNRWTPEANLKRSLAQKGKPKGHGAKISATKRARALLRKQSDEIVSSARN